MYQLCMDNGWGDPFSYARSREIYMAIVMQHTIASTYSGADAFENGELGPVEYKSTTRSKISGTYNGISVQPTWGEQMKYLYSDKICKYLNHFFARFEDGKIVEMWQLTADKVLTLLVPKLKKQYDRFKTSKPKDPRLGATITMTEIHNNGIRII